MPKQTKKVEEVEVAEKQEVKRKPLKVGRKHGTSLFEVYFEGGGELPKELKGMYTSPTVAQAAIDGYLANRK